MNNKSTKFDSNLYDTQNKESGWIVRGVRVCVWACLYFCCVGSKSFTCFQWMLMQGHSWCC